MALGDLFQPLLDRLLDAIKRALGPFGKLFDLVSRFFHGFKDSFDKGNALAGDIITEIHEWRNFRENIGVRTRVISIPAAIDQTQRLLDQVKAAWDSIVDLAQQIKKQLQGQQESPTDEAEAAAKDIESARGITNLLEKFPRLAKGLEKVLGFLAIVIGVLESIQSAIDDLTNILAAIRGIREEIETGSTVFLKQSNPRRNVTLDDGTVMKIRVGNLHS